MDDTLIISDCHAPYNHRDTLAFIRAAKEELGLEKAKSVGDIVDNHSSSFHDLEYGTLSAREEYLAAKDFCQELSEIYPEMTISIGNHCKMTERKANKAMIPLDHIKSYNDIYGVNWKWVDHDWFKVDRYNWCMMTHAMSVNTLTNAKTHSHHSIQGHHHGTFGIQYFADKSVLRWSLTAGCLINPDSPAFNYSKGNTNNRPIVGMAAIIADTPILIPMKLTKSGRWDKRI